MRQALPTTRGSTSGFSLIETLVALALLAAALLWSMSLLAQEPWVIRRLDAHREALRAMEIDLESLRSNANVPTDGDEIPLPFSVQAAQGLVIKAEVSPLPERSLFQVTLVASYAVGDKPYEQRLESLVWRQ